MLGMKKGTTTGIIKGDIAHMVRHTAGGGNLAPSHVPRRVC